MTTPPIHTHLRTLLVRLYPQLDDARRIADDAGVIHHRVAPDGNMTNYWHALLQEAENQGKLDALLARASTEYPQHHELAAIIAAHQHALLPLSDIRLLNFAHAITTEKQVQIETILGKRIDPTLGYHIETKFDDNKPYGPQCVALAEQIGFRATEWQTLPLLINPPSFAPIALCLLTELHGRMRHFPTVLRLRPITFDGARDFEVAEIINLQEIRDRARHRA